MWSHVAWYSTIEMSINNNVACDDLVQLFAASAPAPVTRRRLSLRCFNCLTNVNHHILPENDVRFPETLLLENVVRNKPIHIFFFPLDPDFCIYNVSKYSHLFIYVSNLNRKLISVKTIKCKKLELIIFIKEQRILVF